MKFKDKQSIYLQIGDYICENIILGIWPPGERIPSTREFASEIEVNPNTVVRTYGHLEEMEIIRKKRGVGYFVSDNAVRLIAEQKKKDFIKEKLPEVFKEMILLDISWDDVRTYYDNYKSESDKE